MLVNSFFKEKITPLHRYQTAKVYCNCVFWLQRFHTSPMNHC